MNYPMAYVYTENCFENFQHTKDNPIVFQIFRSVTVLKTPVWSVFAKKWYAIVARVKLEGRTLLPTLPISRTPIVTLQHCPFGP